MKPLRLGPNQPVRFYRGGDRIAAFRGVAPENDHVPEDWVGSTTALFGESSLGLARLPEGELLRDAVASDPVAWLGAAHAERFGGDTALLVKLLDAGQRLPVHCHPSDDFARRHLNCPRGKTEAWVITEVYGDDPVVHLGFRHDVDAEILAGWVERQQTEAMLDVLHRIPVSAGDAVLVPAGIPHAIGAGIFLVELQQPTDLSVLLDWQGFDVDGLRDGHLGLGFEVALSCVDRSGWAADRLSALRRSRDEGRPVSSGVDLALPAEADSFFRAERVRPRPEARLAAAFAILVVITGTGVLTTDNGGTLDVRGGETVLIPHGAGSAVLRGDVEAIRCMPPATGGTGGD